MTVVSVVADQRRRINGTVKLAVAAPEPCELVHGGDPTLADAIRIMGFEVRQRDDGRNRHPCPLNHEPLARGRLVEDLAELRTHLEGADRLHPAMMVL
jgi:hypothetical protein